VIATTRPASLPAGWQGAWAFVIRPALVAIRDRGPLSFREIAAEINHAALHADLTSGHSMGRNHGAEILARAVLEDAVGLVTQLPDGRYAMDPTVREFTSPFTGRTMALYTAEEQAVLSAPARAQRPVRHWMESGVYRPHVGRWRNGLPGRGHTPDEAATMAEVIGLIGWQPGARIVKDQHGVVIDGHLRVAALGLLGIDPDVDPTDGEPYVEIRSFANDAARLHFALIANWTSLKADTRKAISKHVLGGEPVTPATVKALIVPLAMITGPTEITAAPEPVTEPAPKQGGSPPDALTPLNKVDFDVLEQVRRAGIHGVTYKQVTVERGIGGHNENAGRNARRALGHLTAHGRVVKLADKRDRSAIFVTPEFVGERAEAVRREPAATRPEFSNAAVAAMTWREATAPGTTWINGKMAVPYIRSQVSADATVAEVIDGIIDSVLFPWFLPMLCERAGQRMNPPD
jgi:hypothetical protein